MRCMVCGEEMQLVQSVPDETMLVPGFEHHKLVCPCCHDEERRLVFIRHPAPLSPPMAAEGTGSEFVDATLRPIDETAAMDSAVHELSSMGSAGTAAIERAPPPSSPPAQPLTSGRARAANSRVWGSRAELHRARWRVLCERLGLRSSADKAGDPKKE
jgi:hypothetical protein